jgi:hypothetical protein
MKNKNVIYAVLEPSLERCIPNELFGLMNWIQGYYPPLCPGQIAQTPSASSGDPLLTSNMLCENGERYCFVLTDSHS